MRNACSRASSLVRVFALRGALPSGHDCRFAASLHLDSFSSVVSGRYPYGLPFPWEVDVLRSARHVDCAAHRVHDPGVAIVVANLTHQPLAPIGVLLAVVVAEIAVIPYERWRKRLRVASGRGVPSV